MKILNVREGFACNSSSTHSIVLARDHHALRDTADGDYGWDTWVAASTRAKEEWLATTAFQTAVLDLEMNEGNAKALVRGIFGLSASHDYGYVDHQSRISLPTTWDGKGLHLGFLQEFRDYLCNAFGGALVVVGGNDNDDRSVPVAGEQIDFRRILPVEDGLYVARKDPAGYWVLFSRQKGDKIRIAFDHALEIDAQRAAAPELLDIKITDYCPYDCAYCYQGSTTRGGHATNLDALARAVAAAEVFEVAIGGGEPTLHPQFHNFVKALRSLGVVPNVTTKDPKWFMREPESIDHIGAYAVSCEKRDDVEAVVNAIDAVPDAARRRTLYQKCTIQHVVGTADEYGLEWLLYRAGEAKLPVVLLGWKTTHRGAQVTPKTPRGKTWGEFIRALIGKDEKSGEYRFPRLGVDTALAGELAGHVPPYRLTLREGQFSGYIDAVNGRMHASSFTQDEGVPFNPHMAHFGPYFVETWKKITAYKPEGAYTYKHRLELVRA